MWKHIEDFVGNTPMVALKRMPGQTSNTLLLKLEGNNPAGSVKDRPALTMIRGAQERGEIKPGDTLIEATSGNTGIALAMAAAMMGYKMILVMPEHLSVERRQSMAAYGAQIVLTSKAGSMELARDVADQMVAKGKGIMLDQFSNPDNPLAHYEGTGPEIWHDTGGKLTHFVSSMGTTGTIMGCSRYFKELNPAIQIVGVQPKEGAQIPGIRKWPTEYLPEDLRLFPRRSDDLCGPGRGRRDHPETGARRRDLRRHLFRRGVVCRPATESGIGRRGHCVHRLRPGRPLSVHRGVSGLSHY